jgi:hypothetical protein
MVTRYVSLSSNFDLAAWSSAVSREADEHGIEFVAQYMGVAKNTVNGWTKTYDSSYGEFPYPMMTNLLKFCNAFGYDVRDFFTVEG